MSRLIDVVQLLIAPISALAGVLVGGASTAKREHRQWLRDRRHEVYGSVSSAARTMLWRGDEIGRKSDGEDLEDQKSRMRGAMFDVREAVAQLELIGTPKTVKAGQELRSCLGREVFNFFAESSGPLAENAIQVTYGREALTKFQEAARSELQ